MKDTCTSISSARSMFYCKVIL